MAPRACTRALVALLLLALASLSLAAAAASPTTSLRWVGNDASGEALSGRELLQEASAEAPAPEQQSSSSSSALPGASGSSGSGGARRLLQQAMMTESPAPSSTGAAEAPAPEQSSTASGASQLPGASSTGGSSGGARRLLMLRDELAASGLNEDASRSLLQAESGPRGPFSSGGTGSPFSGVTGRGGSSTSAMDRLSVAEPPAPEGLGGQGSMLPGAAGGSRGIGQGVGGGSSLGSRAGGLGQGLGAGGV